ncbi:MAG: hypothetical protein ABJ006_14100, partial [Balneola sp.]
MTQFIFTYHGGQKPETPEAGKEAMEQWKTWAAGLGAALVNPGTPVGITKTLNATGISDQASPHPLMGFSILEAATMDDALELLKNCPHIHVIGGTL